MKTKLEKLRQEFEAPIIEIIGKTLSSVHYADIDSGEECYDYDTFHDIALGIELVFNDKTAINIAWIEKNRWFCLEYDRRPISSWLNLDEKNENRPSFYTLSKNKLWKNKIGKKITSIKSYWNTIEYPLAYFPQDLKIDFENGEFIIVSNMQYDQEKHYIADNLTIFFDHITAKKAGALNNF